MLDRVGYLGVSSDDAARTLIAWNTSHHWTVDPTGSSWLPVHTWELAALLAMTRELAVTPRALSWLGALAATWIAVHIARRLGASPVRALGAGLAALAAPWTIFTAWAPGVPEMPCVAWTLAAAWCLLPAADGTLPSAWRALAAGGCITLACGHRYEAWFAGIGMLAALSVRDRRRPGFVALAWLAAALFPIAWFAINLHRAGDAFDFVHRVVRYRLGNVPGGAPMARALREFLVSDGPALAAGLVGAHVVKHRASVLVAGAMAVLAGVLSSDARGGGPTHHAARTLLLATWLLAPLVPFAAREVRAWSVILGMVLASHATGWRALPRDVPIGSVTTGHLVASLTPRGHCFAIETGREDFLWVELASGRPDDAHPDRAYGGPAPAPARSLAIARDCPVAVAHTPAFRGALITAGWTPRHADGGWFVLTR